MDAGAALRRHAVDRRRRGHEYRVDGLGALPDPLAVLLVGQGVDVAVGDALPGAGRAQRVQGAVLDDLAVAEEHEVRLEVSAGLQQLAIGGGPARRAGQQRRGHPRDLAVVAHLDVARSEEHTSELQSLMPISYAVS